MDTHQFNGRVMTLIFGIGCTLIGLGILIAIADQQGFLAFVIFVLGAMLLIIRKEVGDDY